MARKEEEVAFGVRAVVRYLKAHGSGGLTVKRWSELK